MSTNTYLISGTGSGIGRATALHLANQGHTVVLLGRDKQNLETTLSMLPPGQHTLLLADIRKRDELAGAAESMRDVSFTGLIAAAGVGGWSVWGPDDRWEEIIETNLTGTYNFVNTFYPHLKNVAAPYKHVVIVTSALSKIGLPNFQALSASKEGLHGLMRCWAAQWAPENILVNAISPGWVNTRMASHALDAFAGAYQISKEEAHGLAMKQVPVGRMTEPEEISETIAFLLTQQTMTGSIVDVNGGFVMR